MKRYLMPFVAIIALLGSAVITHSCKAVSPEEAARRAYADSVANNVARLQLKYRKFVLTADQITINQSSLITVSDNTNFVLADSLTGVVQVSPRFAGGPNSLGGFTVTGDITNYEMKTDKDGDVTVTYRLSAPIGSTDVRIFLRKGSNAAEATLTPTFNTGRATLYGKIKALGNHEYFEGRSF
ncbi:MAG: DUF4251 domain-containing protein [Bacteroidales bacterium]|nr:DUF4251 domain-containing protein [Bacteroidales bacterium]